MKKIRTVQNLVVFLLVSTSVKGYADSTEDAFPTIFASFSGTYQTHKSAMIESNDVGIATAYAVGLNAGKERTLGVKYKVDSSSMTFALNNSSIVQSWSDTCIRYRFGGFYIGAVISSVAMTVNSQGTDLVDLVGEGFGGNLGFVVPTRKGNFYMDLVYVTIGQVREVAQQTVTVGPKMDFEMGMNFEMSRSFGNFVGISYKTISSDIGVGGSETLSGIVFGLLAHTNF